MWHAVMIMSHDESSDQQTLNPGTSRVVQVFKAIKVAGNSHLAVASRCRVNMGGCRCSEAMITPSAADLVSAVTRSYCQRPCMEFFATVLLYIKSVGEANKVSLRVSSRLGRKQEKGNFGLCVCRLKCCTTCCCQGFTVCEVLLVPETWLCCFAEPRAPVRQGV